MVNAAPIKIKSSPYVKKGFGETPQKAPGLPELGLLLWCAALLPRTIGEMILERCKPSKPPLRKMSNARFA